MTPLRVGIWLRGGAPASECKALGLIPGVCEQVFAWVLPKGRKWGQEQVMYDIEGNIYEFTCTSMNSASSGP